MAHHSAIERISVGSLDDEQFYSASTSRIASRHASVLTAPRNLQDETTHDLMPSAPVVSVCQPSYSAPVSRPGTQSPVSKHALKPRWAVPFTTRHQHNPKHHHFCPKPLGRRIYRTFHGTSESVPLLQPLINEFDAGPSSFAESPISPSASPAAMARRSSTYIGIRSPRSERSQSLIASPLNGSIGISRQGIDAIARNIRAFLSNRRHNDCSPRTDTLPTANENHPPSGFQKGQSVIRDSHARDDEATADSYLVTTNDVAGILDIVIAGIRRLHDDGSAAECLSMLLPKEPLLRPTPKLKAIIPGSPSIADPATTINSIQASFSFTGYSGHHAHYLDGARTTFISRQSITEVT
ncbi:hypothetical protein F4677DRAFT_262300 [Hypoxylon crocopeplum]|nr:hypothetical protein F4677DRAFT_262300 [Hypoxylon crocopeplum]